MSVTSCPEAASFSTLRAISRTRCMARSKLSEGTAKVTVASLYSPLYQVWTLRM